MTLVVVWAPEINLLRCAADTRLSSGDSTIAETGSKILIVPVAYRASTDVGKPPAGQYSLGFSFSGSSLLATTTHAIASTCCQILHSPKPGVIPSLRVIATIFARVGEYVAKDYNSRVQGSNFKHFEALLFGYCPVNKRNEVFKLTPAESADRYEILIEQRLLAPGAAIGIGTGAEEFKKRATSVSAPAEEIFLDIVEEGAIASVGGHPVFANASELGVEIMPILSPAEGNPDAMSVKVNGFEVGSIEGIDGFSFALQVIGARTERVAGRRALRDIGIDPDAKNIPQGLQNRASVQATLKAAMQNGSKVMIPDMYEMEARRPAMGKWYCVIPCSCGKPTPIHRQCTECCMPSSSTTKRGTRRRGRLATPEILLSSAVRRPFVAGEERPTSQRRGRLSLPPPLRASILADARAAVLV